jgi:hypothetical protein
MPRKGGVPENLKPFQKGHGPIPGNGSKKSPHFISTYLKKFLNAKIDVSQLKLPQLEGILKKKMSVSELIALRVCADAVKGNYKGIETYLDRTEGKVLSPIELMSGGATLSQLLPLNINIMPATSIESGVYPDGEKITD